MKKKNKKIICIDIDNTICKTFLNKYENSKPYKKKIQFINNLYHRGYFIKLFTSRYMGRNKENEKKAKKQGYNYTKKQLKDWGLNYNELIFGKPSFDIYIDDKNLEFKSSWPEILKKRLKFLKNK